MHTKIWASRLWIILVYILDSWIQPQSFWFIGLGWSPIICFFKILRYGWCCWSGTILGELLGEINSKLRSTSESIITIALSMPSVPFFIYFDPHFIETASEIIALKMSNISYL